MNIAIVILADAESMEGLGRVVNALMSAREFSEAGDDVRVVFDGAGVKSASALAAPDHDYHDLLEHVRQHVVGVCQYCADAFGVMDKVQASELPLANEYRDHPSFRNLLQEGYQVLTF